MSADKRPSTNDQKSSRQPSRVLFIGNSYTFYNALPRLVKGLAASADPPVRMNVSQASFGGVTLKEHWTGKGLKGRLVRPDGLRAIRREKLDYVVLQDASAQSLQDPAAMSEYIGLFAQEARSSGAEPLLYMTWAYQNKPQMLDTIKNHYIQVAKTFDLSVAPVGIAWANSLEARADLGLHTEDMSHPNVYGSYLAACVLYCSLTGRSCVGLTPRAFEKTGSSGIAKAVSLPTETAAFLQEIAWSTVSSFSA